MNVITSWLGIAIVWGLVVSGVVLLVRRLRSARHSNDGGSESNPPASFPRSMDDRFRL